MGKSGLLCAAGLAFALTACGGEKNAADDPRPFHGGGLIGDCLLLSS